MEWHFIFIFSSAYRMWMCAKWNARANMCQFLVSMRMHGRANGCECTSTANSPIFFQRRKWSLVILKHFIVIFHFRSLCNCRGCSLWRCPVFVSDRFFIFRFSFYCGLSTVVRPSPYLLNEHFSSALFIVHTRPIWATYVRSNGTNKIERHFNARQALHGEECTNARKLQNT